MTAIPARAHASLVMGPMVATTTPERSRAASGTWAHRFCTVELAVNSTTSIWRASSVARSAARMDASGARVR